MIVGANWDVVTVNHIRVGYEDALLIIVDYIFEAGRIAEETSGILYFILCLTNIFTAGYTLISKYISIGRIGGLCRVIRVSGHMHAITNLERYHTSPKY